MKTLWKLNFLPMANKSPNQNQNAKPKLLAAKVALVPRALGPRQNEAVSVQRRGLRHAEHPVAHPGPSLWTTRASRYQLIKRISLQSAGGVIRGKPRFLGNPHLALRLM